VIEDDEARALIWRQEQAQLALVRMQALRALSAPLGPYQAVREAWRPVELAIAERNADVLTPDEALEEQPDRRNPFGCLIP
jgi:hypothetical protein